MTSGLVRAELSGSCRVLYLARQPANALNAELLAAIAAGARAAGEDEAVRSLVLASDSPKYFSCGLDPEELGPDCGEAPFVRLLETHRALADCPKPVVAAIGGAALLGGFIVSLGCDYRLITEEAKVSLSEVKLGLSPTSALVGLVSNLSSRQGPVKDLVLAGQTLRGKEAVEAGFADRLVSAAELLPSAIQLAEQLGKTAPKAFAAIKRGYRRLLVPEELWDRALDEFRELIGGEEGLEGLKALREKRRPRWG